MTLLDLSEPLFQYICRTNRASRKGALQDMSQVRVDLKAIFAQMERTAPETPGLPEQYRKVRQPLVFFCDYMIRSSGMPFAAAWANLAEEESPPIFAGDELFFLVLDETLQDRSEDANGRLAVFYVCMGLGFYGYYENDPEQVRRRTKEIQGRIRKIIGDDGQGRICAEAYDHLDTSDLTEPPSRSLLPMVIALILLVCVLFVANVWLYRDKTGKLNADISEVIKGRDTALKDFPKAEANK